jgi:tungstate transport system substrate-binding protein
VALGTGQALDIGRRGDADVVFVHDKEAEEKFVADGFGVTRQEVMYNDFVVIGPKSDPAGAAGKDILTALRQIAAVKAPFVSRGDRSGRTRRSSAIGGMLVSASRRLRAMVQGDRPGMGPALNAASAANAYVLSDRGTWLAFKNRGDLTILVEGDQRMFNQYGVMLVNPARHPQVKATDGSNLHRLASIS